MTEVVRITYTPQETDILYDLDQQADLLHEQEACITDAELADLLERAMNEIQRLREQLGRAEISYQQCDSDRRSFAANAAELRAELARLRKVYASETDEFNAGYMAYESAIPFDAEPSSTPHDQWRVGWAWAQFNAQNPGKIP
jgi:hypothetical protein